MNQRSNLLIESKDNGGDPKIAAIVLYPGNIQIGLLEITSLSSHLPSFGVQ